MWEFPKIRGALLWGPYNKDPTIQIQPAPAERIVEARKLEHSFRRTGARISLILYLKGMRIMMSQLSGFYYMF